MRSRQEVSELSPFRCSFAFSESRTRFCFRQLDYQTIRVVLESYYGDATHTYNPRLRRAECKQKKYARAHTHLVSPGAESLDDREVVALALCKRLSRLVRPGLLAERPLERRLIALPRVSRGAQGACVRACVCAQDKRTNARMNVRPKARPERSHEDLNTRHERRERGYHMYF